MKAEQFDKYMMHGHRWSQEAFIPVVLRSIFRSIEEKGSRSVPVSVISTDFRTFFAGNDERKKKSLRKHADKDTVKVLLNIETIDETELRKLLFKRPLGTLGNINRRRNEGYYEFIEYEKGSDIEFINVNEDIFNAYAERSKDWNRVVNDYLEAY